MTTVAQVRTHARRYGDEDGARLRAEHEKGTPLRQIAKRERANLDTIKEAIVRAGGTVNTRPKPHSAREVEYPGVAVVAKSKNRKLGNASATMVAAQSCPSDCPFVNAGCYGEHDQSGLQWQRITQSGDGMTPVELARSEAAAIRSIPAVRPLRLHVVGDSPTREAARVVADACHEYSARGLVTGNRLPAWGYTHSWREVPRSDWWAVSMLASCETPADVRGAWAAGYGAALVVESFPEGGKPFTLGEGEDRIKVAPCPAQVGDTDCTTCQRCFDDRKLLAEQVVIGFETHGGGAKKAAETLRRLSLPMASITKGDEV